VSVRGGITRSKIATLACARARARVSTRDRQAHTGTTREEKLPADNTGNRYEWGGGSGGGRIRPYTLRSVFGGVGEVFCQEEKQIPGGICRSRCSQTRDKQRVRSDDLPKTNGNQTRRPNCNVLPACPDASASPPSVPRPPRSVLRRGSLNRVPLRLPVNFSPPLLAVP